MSTTEYEATTRPGPTPDRLEVTDLVPVLIDSTDASHRRQGIRQRWDASGDQRTAAGEAVANRELGLANAQGDLDERSERLGRRGLKLEGLVETDDSVWLSFFDCGLQAALSVGRVVGCKKRQPARAIGTGSLVSERLLITNHHVCPSPEAAAMMAVQFRYEYDPVGQPRPEDQWLFAPADFFFTDPILDFTVVAVETRNGAVPGTLYGHIQLIGQPGKAVMGELLNVIHHPGGDRKRASIRENRMVAEDEQWLRYQSDTSEGSSGAPVFNDQWEMVALHHGGVPKTDDNGLEIARNGQPWTPDMGEEALAYVGNEGARVSRIVRSLHEALIPEQWRPLVATLLEGGE